MLEPNTAQMIAISLHELATNAAKYGSLSAAVI
jgi:two-component sensor histidine kinase